MSLSDGMAALHLQMPARVPRTEYSADTHWELVKVVTGLAVGPDSDELQRQQARSAFVKAWNYDFMWSTLINDGIFGSVKTSMGHAAYATGASDYNDHVASYFHEPEEVLAFDPWEVYGQRDRAQITRDFDAHYQANCRRYPDAVNMTGVYVTCMSGLIAIFGWDMLLMAAGTDPEAFGQVTNRYASWIEQYFQALAAAQAPVVMVHDDIVWTAGAFVHPDWYRKYIFPNYRRFLPALIDSGKKVLYTSDGDYLQFIDDIAACGVHGFVLEPCMDMQAVAQRYGRTHVIIGNADTRILLGGTRQAIRAEVQRCMDIGKSCPGYVMAVGNHIPSNTPIENALYYNQVYQELSRR